LVLIQIYTTKKLKSIIFWPESYFGKVRWYFPYRFSRAFQRLFSVCQNGSI